jgi:hypothetical protein
LRLESLESRCLLSFAPVGGSLPPSEPYSPDKPTFGRPPIFDSIPPTRDLYDLPPGSIPDGDDDDDSYEQPDPSHQGGPIDLGEFTKPDLGTPGTKSNDDSAAVLALLAGLNFVPRPDAAATAAADAIFAALDPSAPPARTEPIRPIAGGAVAIPRSPLAPSTAPEAAADLDWRLEKPVQMESTRGRFQAFEISTITPPAAAHPETEAADCTPALSSPSSEHFAPASEVVSKEATDPASAQLDSTVETDSRADAEQPLNLLPLTIDESTSLWLNSLAAAILFAWLTRAVRSEEKRKDGQQSPAGVSVRLEACKLEVR